MTKEIKRDGDCVAYIAMSDRLVLFPNGETSTTVWDMENGRSLGLLEGHTNMIEQASLNSVEKAAVTIAIPDEYEDEDTAVKVWSLETMQCTANLTATNAVTKLLNDRLLLGSKDGPIKVWDIGGSTPVALMDLEGHSKVLWDSIRSIDASDTSNVALSGSEDKSVRLWDLRTGQCTRVLEAWGHTNWVLSVSMDSACKTAVSGSMDEMVKLWDLGSGRCIETYDYGQRVMDVMMHESGSCFLASGLKGSCPDGLKAWALGTDKPILDADLSSLGPSDMSFAASRDLSVVATFYLSDDTRDVSETLVWR